jgi:diacylglycerol kinase (ATP)
MFGVGFDGEVAERKAHTFRFIKGFWAYYAQVIPLFFLYRPKPVHIEMNGVIMDTKILFLTVGNGRYSGGGFKLTPLAELDDGLFDVCLIHHPGLLGLFRHVSKVPKGKHLDLPFVFYFRTNEIKITSETLLPAHVDGEIIKEKEFNIKLIPQALNVIVKK